MTRLVLIDKATQTYSVYDNKVCVATYVIDGKDELPGKEEVEAIRVADYPQKA